MNDRDLDDYIRGSPTSAWGHIGRMHKEIAAGGSSSSSSQPVRAGISRGPSYSAPIITRTKAQAEREARRAWAIIGFVCAGWWALLQPEMTTGSAVVAGAIAAVIMYKFYKPILVVGLIAGALALFV